MSDLEQILICAVRYGLRRRTYITGVISDFIILHIRKEGMSDKCRAVMVRDIDEADIECGLGDNCDADAWRNLRKELINNN